MESIAVADQENQTKTSKGKVTGSSAQGSLRHVPSAWGGREALCISQDEVYGIHLIASTAQRRDAARLCL